MGEAEELVARLWVFAERTSERRSDRLRVLLLHSTHHHAEVVRFDHDADSTWVHDPAETIGDLLRQPLLHLKPSRIDIYNARDLREPDDLPVRDVGHVRLAEERQHMVLAQRVELDVAHHDHVVVLFLEDALAYYLFGARAVALGEKRHGVGDAQRRLEQAFALWILAQQLEVTASQRRVLASPIGLGDLVNRILTK